MHSLITSTARSRRLSSFTFLNLILVPVLASAQQATTPASSELDTITVVGQRFEEARNSLSPSAGSSEYVFERQSIQNLPQGDHTPLNLLLLQAPGVANDSY